MTNTVAGAIAYAQNHPTHNGGSWDGKCEAFVHWAGGFTNAFPTARFARMASNVHSPAKLPLAKVPDGWILHWDFGWYGHIGIMTPRGALMASGYTNSIHHALGFIDPAAYSRLTGHRYLGASPDHGGQYMVGVQRTPLHPSAGKPGRTVAALTTGKPNEAFYKRLQWFGRLNGYTGPIDGHMGVNSWEGVQSGLRHWGYTGPIDGEPGQYTRMALQRFAHHFGAKEAVDGSLSTGDYRAIAKGLNTL